MKRFFEACDDVLARGGSPHPQLLVLAMHSVWPDASVADRHVMHPQQALTIADLRRAIKALRDDGFEFISVDQLAAGGLSPEGRYALLTFDDGYANNLVMEPLLAREAIPAAFFVVPENLESGQSFWWDAVYRRGRRGGQSPRKIEAFLRRVKRLHPAGLRDFLTAAGMGEQDFVPTGEIDRPMTVEELRQFSRSPWVTIGNHTFAHEILPRCSAGERHATIERAQRWIAERCGRRPIAIAYPNGDTPTASDEWLRGAGIAVGFTLCEEFCAPGAHDPTSIGRFLLFGGDSQRAQCRRMQLKFSTVQTMRRFKRMFPLSGS